MILCGFSLQIDFWLYNLPNLIECLKSAFSYLKVLKKCDLLVINRSLRCRKARKYFFSEDRWLVTPDTTLSWVKNYKHYK